MNPRDKKHYEQIVRIIREKIPKGGIISEQYIKEIVENEGIEVVNIHSVLQKAINTPYLEKLDNENYRRTGR